MDPNASEQTPRSSAHHQICQGLFKNQAILDVVLLYYGKRGIKDDIPTVSSPTENPIGILALACTAVQYHRLS